MKTTATNPNQTPSLIRRIGVGILLTAMVLLTAGSGTVRYSGLRNVQSRLMAAGEVVSLPVATGANFEASALALRHWDKSEITVHVSASASDNKTPQQVAELSGAGIGLWNARIGKFLAVKLTERTDADVTVDFVTPGTLPGGAIGETNVQFNPEDASISHAAIQINERLSKAQLVQVVAHEMGHALGIQGHSSDKHDVMYPTAHLPIEVTDRDVNTLKLGYMAAVTTPTE